MVTRADPPSEHGRAPAPEHAAEAPLAGLRQGEPTRRDRLRDAAVVVIPAAMGAVLCGYGIAGRSLGFDEAASVTIAAQHGGALGSAIAHDGGNMSGYYLLLHVLIGLFGNSEFVIRLPSAVATASTVAVVCMLALRLFDRRVAIVSGLLTAVSLPLVFWAQSARGYAPMVALVSASYLAFVTLIDSDPDEPPSPWALIGYVVFTTLAIYSSFVAALVIPAQLVTLLWRRGPVRRLGLALAAIAVCCIPLVVLAASRGSGQLFWVPRPSITSEKQVLESLTSSGLPPVFRSTSTTAVLLGLTVVLLVLIAAAIVRQLLSEAGGRKSWGQTLALSWLVVPVALAWLESLVGQPIFLPRNLLLSIPAVALLLALGVTDRRVPGALAWPVLVALLALRVLQLAPSYGVSPEDWQAATAYVMARAQASDCIAFYPSDGRMAFQYYIGTRAPATARAPRSVLPVAPWGQVRAYVEDYVSLPQSELVRLPSRCPRLWFVSSHQGRQTGPPGSRLNYARYVTLGSTLAAEYARRLTVSFGYASPVRVELLMR